MAKPTSILPDKVFLIAQSDETFIAAAPPDEEIVALVAFDSAEDATRLASEFGPEAKVIRIDREAFIDAIRENVRERILSDGRIWIIKGNDYHLKDVLSSNPYDAAGHCNYCGTADIERGKRRTISIPYTGKSVKGRRLEVAVRIGVIHCAACDHPQVDKITFPLDPDHSSVKPTRSRRRKR